MILSIDKRKPDLKVSDKDNFAVKLHVAGGFKFFKESDFYKLCGENKGTYQMSTYFIFVRFSKTVAQLLVLPTFKDCDNFGHRLIIA